MKTLDKNQRNNVKRAVIYVRVSTEKQAEKVSPEAQEQDGRAYATSQGYTVVAVFRDVERYRVGRRFVEPSGTRNDRPGLKRMLEDAYAGKFDVIIAWREDRLYRGLRPMMDVLECLKETEVDIELVNETFDKNFATVKVWVASMELEARRERTAMGMKGRLGKGKIASSAGNPPYGYDYNPETGNFIINAEEAKWVRQIWQWYAEGISRFEIRRRLINKGVPQRNHKPRKYDWHISVIKKILRREYYFSGIFVSTWAGQRYEIPIHPIIEQDLFQSVQEQITRWKKYPAGKSRQFDEKGQPVHPVYSLASGLAYCAACGVKMRLIRLHGTYQRKYKDKTYTYERHYDYYKCTNTLSLCSLPGCAGSVQVKKLDEEIWRKVWKLVSEPGEFERALEQQIVALKLQETDAEGECKQLERELENLLLERQKYITWAGKEIITEQDLEIQLSILTEQESQFKRDLANMRLLTGNRAERLLQLMSLYREHARIGYEAVNLEADTPELEKAQFEARRRIVDGLVTRVEVLEDKSVKVEAEIKFDEPDPGLNTEEVFSTSETFHQENRII